MSVNYVKFYKSTKNGIVYVFKYDSKADMTYRYYYEYNAWEAVCDGDYTMRWASSGRVVHDFKEMSKAEVFALCL